MYLKCTHTLLVGVWVGLTVLEMILPTWNYPTDDMPKKEHQDVCIMFIITKLFIASSWGKKFKAHHLTS